MNELITTTKNFNYDNIEVTLSLHYVPYSNIRLRPSVEITHSYMGILTEVFVDNLTRDIIDSEEEAEKYLESLKEILIKNWHCFDWLITTMREDIPKIIPENISKNISAERFFSFFMSTPPSTSIFSRFGFGDIVIVENYLTGVVVDIDVTNIQNIICKVYIRRYDEIRTYKQSEIRRYPFGREIESNNVTPKERDMTIEQIKNILT